MVAKLCNVYIFDTSKSGTFWSILTDRLEVGEGLRAGRCTSTSALAASLLVELFLACMVTDSVEKSWSRFALLGWYDQTGGQSRTAMFRNLGTSNIDHLDHQVCGMFSESMGIAIQITYEAMWCRRQLKTSASFAWRVLAMATKVAWQHGCVSKLGYSIQKNGFKR